MFTLTIFDLKSTNTNLQRKSSSGCPKYKCHFALFSFFPFSFMVIRKSSDIVASPTFGFSGVLASVFLSAFDLDWSSNASISPPLALLTTSFIFLLRVFCISANEFDIAVTFSLMPPMPSALASAVIFRAKYLSISSS